MSKLVGSVTGSGRSPGALKTTASSAAAITKTLRTTLKALGRPQTNAGTRAKQSLEKLAGELSQGTTTIRQALESASGPAGVAAAVTTSTMTLASMKSSAATAVKQLEQLDAKGELGRALKSADACSPFVG